MNKFLLVIAAVLSLSACAAPPQDANSAESGDGTVITKAN